MEDSIPIELESLEPWFKAIQFVQVTTYLDVMWTRMYAASHFRSSDHFTFRSSDHFTVENNVFCSCPQAQNPSRSYLQNQDLIVKRKGSRCNGSQSNIRYHHWCAPWTNDDHLGYWSIRLMPWLPGLAFSSLTQTISYHNQTLLRLMRGGGRMQHCGLISVVDFYNLDRNIVITECFHQQTHPILSHRTLL
jgi:hypothetical protein